MISRSPRWTGVAAVSWPRARRSGIVARRRFKGLRRRRRGRNRANAQRPQPGEWLVPAVFVLHQQRQAEHGAPAAPLRRCLVGFGREKQRQRQAWILVREHDGDVARHQAQGYSGKGRDRQIERHAHAGEPAAHHHAGAMQLDFAHPLVGNRVARRKPHRQGERVEPQRAARPGRASATSHLTPQTLPRRAYGPGRYGNHGRNASESA